MSDPITITVGPDGDLWFTEFNTNKIGKITPSGAITEYSVTGSPDGIVAGPDGNLYFTEFNGNAIGRISTSGVFNPATDQIGLSTAGSQPSGITVGPNGNLYFTEAGTDKVGEVTTGLTLVGEFGGLPAGSGPAGIVTGPDGNLWFTEFNGNAVGRMTPAGTFNPATDQLTLPTANSDPLGITVGPNGNLWFTESGNNKIGEITTGLTLAGEFTIPTAGSGPFGITTGSDGDLWFTEALGNKIGQMTPAGSVIGEFTVPTANSGPTGITKGPDGNLWFTEAGETVSQIGRLSLPLTITPVTVTAKAGVPLVNVEVATFTNGNPNASASSFAATINWGDNTPPTAATITKDASGVFHVSGSHTYTRSGSFTITTQVQEAGGSAITGTGTATVTPAPLTAQAVPLVGKEGTALPATTVLATFTDTGQGSQPATSFSATVDFGDGSAPVTLPVTQIGDSTYEVLGGHTYNEEGIYPVSVSIFESAVSTTVPMAVVGSQATIADVAPVASPANFTTTEGQQFNGTVATFHEVYGSNLEPASDFQASVDWGDGTPSTAGTIVTVPSGGFQVTGIHTYADARANGGSGSFPVTVSIRDLDGTTTTQVTSTATVNDVPITLTGQLNPASDSGQSNHDAITNVAQPNFIGTSEPLSTITLTATPTGGGSPITLGTATADASGAWSVTTTSPLADGTYTVTARAVDQAGFTTATTQVLPSSTEGPLTIDTVGPKITGVQFDPLTGRFAVGYQDNLSGLNQRSVIDGANYSFSSTFTKTRLAFGTVFEVTSLTTSKPSSSTGQQVVIGTINNNQELRGGLYQLKILTSGVTNPSGIQDVAGNPMDGEFYGYFPSGNQVNGGDFGARLGFIHGRGTVPQPLTSTASPNNPVGTTGQPFLITPLAVREFGRLTGFGGRVADPPRGDAILRLLRGGAGRLSGGRLLGVRAVDTRLLFLEARGRRVRG